MWDLNPELLSGCEFYPLVYRDHTLELNTYLFIFHILGPAINSIVTDSEEPHPSLSDWHDYEPNLEFDDTELTHPPETSNFHN